MEDVPPPDPEVMKDIFAHLYSSCRRSCLPIGILPIEVSLVVQPEEAADLVETSVSTRVYEAKLSVLRTLARPYIAWKSRIRAA